MNKYLHPGPFFLGSHRFTHDSGEELHVLLSRRLSGRLAGEGQMHEWPTTSERAYVTP
jgi:hypothetical protein